MKLKLYKGFFRLYTVRFELKLNNTNFNSGSKLLRERERERERERVKRKVGWVSIPASRILRVLPH